MLELKFKNLSAYQIAKMLVMIEKRKQLMKIQNHKNYAARLLPENKK